MLLKGGHLNFRVWLNLCFAELRGNSFPYEEFEVDDHPNKLHVQELFDHATHECLFAWSILLGYLFKENRFWVGTHKGNHVMGTLDS